VTSYNGMKGFGFITMEGSDGDIMFSRRDLPEDANEVQGKFLQGQAVNFELTEGKDGRLKAQNLQIVPTEGAPAAGMVKSFSEKNGYGFLSSTSLGGDDLRFARMDLQAVSVPVQSGMKMIFEIVPRPDGKLMAKSLRLQNEQQQHSFMGAGGHGAMMPTPPPRPMGKTLMPTAGKGFGGKGGGAAGGYGGGDMSGTVKSFSERNGYGFINVPGQAGDVKFGAQDLLGITSIAPGTPVQFESSFAPDGRMQAKSVTPGGSPGGGMKRAAPAPAFMGGPTRMAQPVFERPSKYDGQVPAAKRMSATMLPYARHF